MTAEQLFRQLEDINPLAFKSQRNEALALITAALPPAMTWTTTKPTKPGWYWWRFNLGRPRVTELVVRYGELYDDDRKHFVSDYVQQCEWAGPLEPPQ